jgi:tetratricopeptide (TPR) repeat protein
MGKVIILHSWRTLYEWGNRIDVINPELAIAIYEQSLQVTDNEKRLSLSATNLGTCYYRLGRTSQANDCFLKATQLDPSVPEAWYNMSVLLFERGKTEQAKLGFKKALELDPGFEDARYYLGKLS